MLVVNPFAAWRPKMDLAENMVVLPYDVLSEEDVKSIAKANPQSFVRIIRSEVDLSEVDPHSSEVYKRAKKNLDGYCEEGLLIKETHPAFYVYEETLQGHVQRGLVLIADVKDYERGAIAKHELTLHVKEQDRIDHFTACAMQTEPVLLFAKELTLEPAWYEGTPLYDFVAHGVRHRLWAVQDEQAIAAIQAAFQAMDKIYIADGHHRTASAAKVSEQYQCGIMAVVFPAEELTILPYHRLIKDLGDWTPEALVEALNEDFLVTPMNWQGEMPSAGEFIWLFSHEAYKLCYKGDKQTMRADEQLDVAVVQKYILDKLLHIKDPRNDPRLSFVGGMKAREKIEAFLQDNPAAIIMPATTIEDITTIADHELIMPPKSTWFEPKLISGLFIYDYKA